MTAKLGAEELQELLEDTLDLVVNGPLIDYLRGLGHPAVKTLDNPDIDIHTKIDEIMRLSCSITLDLEPVDNGNKRTQEQWFNEYWNGVKDENKAMASMGDLYRNFKQMRYFSEHGDVNQKALVEKLLGGLRNDFDWSIHQNWLISSTRLVYAGNDILEGEIIHHHNRPDLEKRTNLILPVFIDTPVEEAVSSEDGLRYLQILHDTEDDGEDIIQTLELVSDMRRENIRIWTANTEGTYTRSSHPARSAGFYYGNYQFRVNGNSNFNSQGCSCGVFITP